MWHQKLLKVHLTSYENLWKKSLLFTVSSFCSSQPCRLESLRLKMPSPEQALVMQKCSPAPMS